MKNVIRLAIVDPNENTRSSLKNLLLGIDMVWFEAECSRYEYFPDVVMQSQPDIAIISLDADPEQGLALVAQLSQDLPNCQVLVISTSQEGSLILKAMRNGAKEFLCFPLKLENFMAALDRLQYAQGGAEGDHANRPSQVITVAGVSGGTGCTSMATNIACALAQNERNSVALIDLDLALGDADVWLDIIPDYTIQDVAENITRLDYSLLKRSLTKHECGAFLLPRPNQVQDRSLITPDALRRVIALLKATFSHLIVDVSKSYGALDLAAMEVSDSILLVTQLDLPSLRNVVRLIQFFEQENGLSEKIKVIINRVGLDQAQISIGKALETIGREIYWQIPNDYSALVESRNNGVPLLMQAPKSKLTKAIEKLAQSLDGSDDQSEKADDPSIQKGKGLFSFFSSSKT